MLWIWEGGNSLSAKLGLPPVTFKLCLTVGLRPRGWRSDSPVVPFKPGRGILTLSRTVQSQYIQWLSILNINLPFVLPTISTCSDWYILQIGRTARLVKIIFFIAFPLWRNAGCLVAFCMLCVLEPWYWFTEDLKMTYGEQPSF